MTEGSAPPRHGQLAYLQIPAADITRSAEFYTSVFGWQTSAPDSGFEAPALIGQWVEDRPVAAAEVGPLLWLMVADLDESLAQVVRHGGDVLDPPTLDGGVRWLATAHDCAGNALGLVQLGERRGAASTATGGGA